MRSSYPQACGWRRRGDLDISGTQRRIKVSFVPVTRKSLHQVATPAASREVMAFAPPRAA